MKTTKLTAEFRFDDFLARYGPSVLVLLRVDAKGRLLVQTADANVKAKGGDTLIALVDQQAAKTQEGHAGVISASA